LFNRSPYSRSVCMVVDFAYDGTQGVARCQRNIGGADDEVPVTSQSCLQFEGFAAGHLSPVSDITGGQTKCSKGTGVAADSDVPTRVITNNKLSSSADASLNVCYAQVIDFFNHAFQCIFSLDGHVLTTNGQRASTRCAYLLRD